MNSVIQLQGVTKRYGRQTALDNVSLEVPRGVVFGLLGENGAGKTTAIRILLGLSEADEGEARVVGLDSRTDGLAIRQRVGYVPERPTMYDWMTVHEIGWFTAGFYGRDYLPRYLRLIEQYSLDPKKKLQQLSKGMRAKVALALALGHDPELLILDEPTSGLDTLVRREFLESMVDRAASGYTVFLSSHQLGEVERVADIVGIVRDGRLVVVESLEKLKNSVQELNLTLAEPATALPEINGQILREQRHGRQVQLLVRDATPEAIASLRNQGHVQHIDTRTPDLEEIFVAYMHTGRDKSAIKPSPEPSIKEVPTS